MSEDEKTYPVLLSLTVSAVRTGDQLDGFSVYRSDEQPEEGQIIIVTGGTATYRARVTHVFPDGKLEAMEIEDPEQLAG